MPCDRIHTKIQPTADEFKCPRCGSVREIFHIDGDYDTDPDGCKVLHIDDVLVCDRCNYTCKGRNFSTQVELHRTGARDRVAQAR